ncbi:histidine ammonia-lyase [Jatrophihabitans endophyticus]|uniref:Histidine ammonia-lyase n=1 Tax=Jatrophihabitans endophyticus TaxID=1206085 RepID=A0A1M5C3E2_9ACTN|nr:aromatic amino acid ammonia-lyase [Jatrophihabitans endophyticus]SHF49293.1 histidine ammonia-lyase [Jatrophihabitans endophyticus]
MNTIRVDGQHLSVDELVPLAGGPLRVSVTDEARDRVRRSHEWAVRLSDERPMYGRSTGVGANREVRIEPSVAAAQALLTSHATSAGPPRSPDRVRALLLVRLNQLCAGGSGVSPLVVDELARLICDDALPVIHEHAGVGTADLSALAATALAVQEHSRGHLVEPLLLGPDDALPFLSSNAAALADAGLALSRYSRAARSGLAVAALSFDALGGNIEAFSRAVERVTPMLGARATCRAMRALIGSEASHALRIQDPYGLRALPQSHGVLLDSLAALRDAVDAYVNAPSENPVVLPDGAVAHHGGFHASYLSVASDTVRNAAVQSAQLALHRLTYLSEPQHTGLTPFLGDGTPGASGVMLVEYVAASALGDLRAAAAPAAVQTTSLSRGAEDTASFASLAARQLLDSAESYELLVAAELLNAVRAHRLRGRAPDGPLRDVLAACAGLADDHRDRDLTADLETARTLIAPLTEFVDLQLPDTSWENDLG